MVGDLEVTKTVESDLAADADVEFEFTVTLGDTTISGTYGEMTFENGVATFKLKGGESKTAEGLPTDVTYTVVETANEDFTTEKTGDTGAIGTEKSTAAFTNTRVVANLTLTKIVEGNMGDRNKDFYFTIELNDKTISGEYGDLTFTNGEAEVTLKHDQSVVISGLPTDVHVTITEVKTEASNYITKVEKKIGDGQEVTVIIPEISDNEEEEYDDPSPVSYDFDLEADTAITYTNELELPPDTGVSLDQLPYEVMLGLSLVLMVMMAIRRRKEREE